MAEYFLKIGGAAGDIGEIRYGFRAPDDAYDGIGDELGITKLGEGDDKRGVAFGINTPKPPRVRITYTTGSAVNGSLRTRSILRFCDPDKIGSVLNGSINDKEITVAGSDRKIKGVSVPG